MRVGHWGGDVLGRSGHQDIVAVVGLLQLNQLGVSRGGGVYGLVGGGDDLSRCLDRLESRLVLMDQSLCSVANWSTVPLLLVDAPLHRSGIHAWVTVHLITSHSTGLYIYRYSSVF